jgi:hypothetical protein
VRVRLGAGLAVVLLGAGAVDACEVPPGFTPRGRLESSGIVVLFRTVPPAIVIGRHFAVETLVCAEGPAAVLAHVNADMPEHRHGMNYRPTIAAKGAGRWVADGLLFHMPGRWQLSFDVERDGRRTRLATDLLVE